MDLNKLEWNGVPDGKIKGVFVSFDLNGIQVKDGEVTTVELKEAKEYALYGRVEDGTAVHLHDSPTLGEAVARLMLLESSLDTPSSRWEASGEDPHGERYYCRRSELALGHFTDDELANAVFLHNHRELNVQAILAGEPSSIGLLTAAKERIRWLSRRLSSKLGSRPGDLYWNEAPRGTLPFGTLTNVSLSGWRALESVPLESADRYLIEATFDDVVYKLHSSFSLSEARERITILETLYVQG